MFGEVHLWKYFSEAALLTNASNFSASLDVPHRLIRPFLSHLRKVRKYHIKVDLSIFAKWLEVAPIHITCSSDINIIRDFRAGCMLQKEDPARSYSETYLEKPLP